MDESGSVLGRGRFSTGVSGLAQLHALVADHAEEPDQVIVGIEIDRGLLVDSLVGAGYQVYGVNPLAASRYRDRHTTSGAKSDAGDAKLLADLVRPDRHNHRPIAGDTEEAGAIRILAWAHQGLVWTRQRQVNFLRSALRDYFPAALCACGTELAQTDALAILSVAPTPERARALSRTKIAAALRRAGRQRNVEQRAIELQAALRTEQPEGPSQIAEAFGAATAARVHAWLRPVAVRRGRFVPDVLPESASRVAAHPNHAIEPPTESARQCPDEATPFTEILPQASRWMFTKCSQECIRDRWHTDAKRTKPRSMSEVSMEWALLGSNQ